MKKLHYFFLSCFLVFSVVRCISPRKAGNDVIKLTDFARSHNPGKDCMTCHNTKGSEKLSFKVAGTVYDENDKVFQGATVTLFSKSGGSGEPVVSLITDRKGNFYSVSTVDFGTGLYPGVVAGTRNISMDTPVTSGACNSCHGKTVGIISVR